MSPRVSVILPIYNVALYIEATIDSILKQTFTDFELLVLDDCSTDVTAAKVSAIRDPRIKFIRNSHNLGRAGTDNAALEYVRGEYIAKMDGDDICHPERLAQQVAFLDQHPDINIVGSFMQNFGASTYLNRYPEMPADAQCLTLFTLPTGNPSVMLRTSLFREQHMQYDYNLRQTEDYDFFVRYIRQLRIYTIQTPLIQYRVFSEQYKKGVLSERASVADTVRSNLLTAWEVRFTEQEINLHNALAMLAPSTCQVDLLQAEKWLLKLLDHNTNIPWFEPAALRRCLGQRWFEVCHNYVQPRLGSIRRYYQSPLAAWGEISKSQQARLWIKSLLQFY